MLRKCLSSSDISLHLLVIAASNSLFMASIFSLLNSSFYISSWTSYWSESLTSISVTACCWSISFVLNPQISSGLGNWFSPMMWISRFIQIDVFETAFSSSVMLFLLGQWLLDHLPYLFASISVFWSFYEYYFFVRWSLDKRPLLLDYGSIITIRITLWLWKFNKN